MSPTPATQVHHSQPAAKTSPTYAEQHAWQEASGKDKRVPRQSNSPSYSRWGSDRSSGQVTPQDELDEEAFDPADEPKTAYYGYASEKSLSQAESKLFYQRHQLENGSQQDLRRSRTYSSLGNGDNNLSRATSTTSRHSGRVTTAKEKPWRIVQEQENDLSRSTQGLEARHVASDPPVSTFVGEARAEAAERDPVYDIYHHFELKISSELSGIAKNIKDLLDLRHKYINVSLQDAGSNPKDDTDHWTIYPPPPNPTWDDNKTRPIGQLPISEDKEDDVNSRSRPGPASPMMTRRKPGQDIGEDFDMSHLEPLPLEDTSLDFRLDSNSVYQICPVSQPQDDTTPLVKVPTLRDFYKDMNRIQDVSSDGPTKSFAYRQLDILEGKFHLYSLVNSYQETADCKRVPRNAPYIRTLPVIVVLKSCRPRFLQRQKGRHSRSSFSMHESKAFTAFHQKQNEEISARDRSIPRRKTPDVGASVRKYQFDCLRPQHRYIGHACKKHDFLSFSCYLRLSIIERRIPTRSIDLTNLI